MFLLWFVQVKELESEIKSATRDGDQKTKKQTDLRKKIDEFDEKLRAMRSETDGKKK